MTESPSRSPFEQLASFYDHEELRCPECGYVDENGAWESETDGHEVHYHHTCPRCEAVREHTVTMPDR